MKSPHATIIEVFGDALVSVDSRDWPHSVVAVVRYAVSADQLDQLRTTWRATGIEVRAKSAEAVEVVVEVEDFTPVQGVPVKPLPQQDG